MLVSPDFASLCYTPATFGPLAPIAVHGRFVVLPDAAHYAARMPLVETLRLHNAFAVWRLDRALERRQGPPAASAEPPVNQYYLRLEASRASAAYVLKCAVRAHGIAEQLASVGQRCNTDTFAASDWLPFVLQEWSINEVCSHASVGQRLRTSVSRAVEIGIAALGSRSVCDPEVSAAELNVVASLLLAQDYARPAPVVVHELCEFREPNACGTQGTPWALGPGQYDWDPLIRIASSASDLDVREAAVTLLRKFPLDLWVDADSIIKDIALLCASELPASCRAQLLGRAEQIVRACRTVPALEAWGRSFEWARAKADPAYALSIAVRLRDACGRTGQ